MASHKYEFVIEATVGGEHIKSHKSSFGINAIMMENVLFMVWADSQHYDLSPLENSFFLFGIGTLMYTFFRLAVISFTFISLHEHSFYRFCMFYSSFAFMEMGKAFGTHQRPQWFV